MPYRRGDEAWEPLPRKEREQAGSAARPWTATDNRDEDEPDGRTARRVARLIEQHKDRPFFIAAGFNKPHIHWVAPRRYFDLYPPDRIVLPAEPSDDRDDIPEIAIFRKAPRSPGRFLGGTGDRDDAFRRGATAAYYACVSFVDAQVGVLLQTLDRLKLRDRTLGAPRSPPELGRSLRTERWRYTEWPDGGRELYDLGPPGPWARFLAAVGLQREPAAPRNLASDPRFAGTIAEMQALLDWVGGP